MCCEEVVRGGDQQVRVMEPRTVGGNRKYEMKRSIVSNSVFRRFSLFCAGSFKMKTSVYLSQLLNKQLEMESDQLSPGTGPVPVLREKLRTLNNKHHQ